MLMLLLSFQMAVSWRWVSEPITPLKWTYYFYFFQVNLLLLSNLLTPFCVRIPWSVAVEPQQPLCSISATPTFSISFILVLFCFVLPALFVCIGLLNLALVDVSRVNSGWFRPKSSWSELRPIRSLFFESLLFQCTYISDYRMYTALDIPLPLYSAALVTMDWSSC